MKIKNLISYSIKYLKKYTPDALINMYKRIIKTYNVLILSIYDFIKFYNHSASVKGDYFNKNTLLSSIIMDYHRIEKGLSFSDTKPRFGFWFIPDLVNRICYYYENYGEHEVIIASINALKSDRSFHSNNNITLDELKDSFEKLDLIGDISNGEGVVKISSFLNEKK